MTSEWLDKNFLNCFSASYVGKKATLKRQCTEFSPIKSNGKFLKPKHDDNLYVEFPKSFKNTSFVSKINAKGKIKLMVFVKYGQAFCSTDRFSLDV